MTPEATLFSNASGETRTHNTLLSRESALPTELLRRLRWQGLKSQIQHNTMQGNVSPNNLYIGASIWYHHYDMIIVNYTGDLSPTEATQATTPASK